MGPESKGRGEKEGIALPALRMTISNIRMESGGWEEKYKCLLPTLWSMNLNFEHFLL